MNVKGVVMLYPLVLSHSDLKQHHADSAQKDLQTHAFVAGNPSI